MKKIIKRNLDFILTVDYFLKTLVNANYVSSVLIESVNFSEGSFFTMLPDSADHKKIYEFSSGGILQQNPIQRGAIGSLNGIYEFSEIPSITNELANLIKNFLEESDKSVCLIDDVIRDSNDSFQNDLELFECAAFHKLEVCYLINILNKKKSLIIKCLQNSRAYWHSLCIFSKLSTQYIHNKSIPDSIIKEICLNSQLLVVGAYDGEGYVFWEKN